MLTVLQLLMIVIFGSSYPPDGDTDLTTGSSYQVFKMFPPQLPTNYYNSDYNSDYNDYLDVWVPDMDLEEDPVMFNLTATTTVQVGVQSKTSPPSPVSINTGLFFPALAAASVPPPTPVMVFGIIPVNVKSPYDLVPESVLLLAPLIRQTLDIPCSWQNTIRMLSDYAISGSQIYISLCLVCVVAQFMVHAYLRRCVEMKQSQTKLNATKKREEKSKKRMNNLRRAKSEIMLLQGTVEKVMTCVFAVMADSTRWKKLFKRNTRRLVLAMMHNRVLTTSLDTAKNTIHSLRQLVDQKTLQVEALETDKSNILRLHRNKLAESADRVQSLEEALSRTSTDITKLSKTKQDLELRVNELETFRESVANVARERDDAFEECRKKEYLAEQTRAENNAKTTTISSLQEQIEQFKRNMYDVEQERNTANARALSLENEIKSDKKAMNALEKKHKEELSRKTEEFLALETKYQKDISTKAQELSAVVMKHEQEKAENVQITLEKQAQMAQETLASQLKSLEHQLKSESAHREEQLHNQLRQAQGFFAHMSTQLTAVTKQRDQSSRTLNNYHKAFAVLRLDIPRVLSILKKPQLIIVNHDPRRRIHDKFVDGGKAWYDARHHEQQQLYNLMKKSSLAHLGVREEVQADTLKLIRNPEPTGKVRRRHSVGCHEHFDYDALSGSSRGPTFPPVFASLPKQDLTQPYNSISILALSGRIRPARLNQTELAKVRAQPFEQREFTRRLLKPKVNLRAKMAYEQLTANVTFGSLDKKIVCETRNALLKTPTQSPMFKLDIGEKPVQLSIGDALGLDNFLEHFNTQAKAARFEVWPYHNLSDARPNWHRMEARVAKINDYIAVARNKRLEREATTSIALTDAELNGLADEKSRIATMKTLIAPTGVSPVPLRSPVQTFHKKANPDSARPARAVKNPPVQQKKPRSIMDIY